MSLEMTGGVVAGGLGTRASRITADYPKILLPAGELGLVIDVISAQVADAGFTRAKFLVAEDDELTPRHFDSRPKLTKALASKALTSPAMADDLAFRQRVENKFGLEVSFVHQPSEENGGKYGTAYAAQLLDRPMLYMSGDDVIVRRDHQNELTRFYQAWQASGAMHAIMAIEVPEDAVQNYGIVDPANGRIIDRPARHEAPSRYAFVSRAFFNEEFWPVLDTYMTTPQDDEWKLTDVINVAAESQSVYVHRLDADEAELVDFGATANHRKGLDRLADLEYIK